MTTNMVDLYCEMEVSLDVAALRSVFIAYDATGDGNVSIAGPFDCDKVVAHYANGDKGPFLQWDHRTTSSFEYKYYASHIRGFFFKKFGDLDYDGLE